MTHKESDPPAGNPRVSLTAYATAAAWAHFGFEHAGWFDSYRGRALFYAMHYGGRALARAAPNAGVFTQTLYWRHRWFSAWVEARAPTLAVEIGAGLSARGIAWAERHPSGRWLDYDLPDMVAARRARLGRRRLPANYRLAPGDLLDPTLGAELDAAADGNAVVLTEGVTDYLDRDERRRAWRAVAGLLARRGGGRYLFECHPRDRLALFGAAAPIFLAGLRRITGRDMAAQLCATPDEAIAMLRACGFTRPRVLGDPELADAGRAPAPNRRAFVLIEAALERAPWPGATAPR